MEVTVEDLLALPGSGQEVKFSTGGESGVLDVIHVGKISVQGDLLIADPSDFVHGFFTEVPFPDGEYDVALGVVRFDSPGVLIATLVFGEVDLATSWQSLDLLMVDSGAGVLMSRHILDLAAPALVDAERWDAVARAVMEQGYARLPEQHASCLVFESGPGDGNYPIYVGADLLGETVALLIDLEILHDITGS